MKKLIKKLKRWSIRTRIKAVSDDDSEYLLTSLGLIESLNNNKLKCVICGKQICIDNWQLIGKVKGNFVLSCNSSNCVVQFKDVVQEMNK